MNKMKVVILSLLAASASSNMNKRSYNFGLRGLERVPREHRFAVKPKSASAKIAAVEKEKHGEATAEKNRKKKKEMKKEKADTKSMSKELINDAPLVKEADEIATAVDGWAPTLPPILVLTPKPSTTPSQSPSTTPSQSPSSVPSVVPEQTILPTFSPTLAPAIEIESKQATDAIPACPPAYDTTVTTYLGGDLVAVTDNIFECNSLYEMYCNIGEWDDALMAEDAEADEKWSNAWVYVGPCSALAALDPESTLLPTFSPTFSPTLAPSIVVTYAQAANAVPACPPDYNITKTDYLGGDKVTVTESIFECHSLSEVYCNIGEWDAALLDQDAEADEKWSNAWVYVGPCV
jgi:hypothetical protein